MTINYIIVDDEHIAHDIIKKYCDMLPNMNLLKDCYDAIEALDFLNTSAEVDLIFLDLNMPKLKGFQFLRTLPKKPKVIVTTAYQEFALEGYELDIVDYLLKPFSFERLLKAVNKAFPQPPEKSTIQQKKGKIQRMFLRSDKKHIQVAVDDILYFEASGNYTKVVLKEETITIRETIANLIYQLPESDFMQVHRSFIVALNHIRSIEGNQIIIADHKIPVGKFYKENVIRLFND
ncbi:LytTR family DNA-binding domain-containing protein [Gramella sp. MAR_2010_147]|uniref:LytR/AlgR family response regulator transcription factor n=1 Tax=Gramella sp. MAR_2010_147 TaxID=1250205 RepID=UPI00087CA027|nr:LytTR family DNA-binding domain-containing protein [Gramella sp. MAR_2010_147]SDR93784.1 DNA-binding response regulator, LytR/AlgR family [Gramella sp. MAR_2010_147]